MKAMEKANEALMEKMREVCLPFVYYMVDISTIYLPSGYYLSTICLLSIYYISTICLLAIYDLSTIYLLSIYYL